MSDLLKKFEEIAECFKETKEVEILGHKFVLSVMSSASDTDSHEAANPFSKIAYLYALKIESLARSIVSIDDNEIPEEVPTGRFVGGKSEVLSRVLFLREQLGRMPQEVVDVLWRHYGELAQSIGVKIDPDHPLRQGFFSPPTNKDLSSLAETDAREIIEREVEVESRRRVDAEEVDSGAPGSKD